MARVADKQGITARWTANNASIRQREHLTINPGYYVMQESIERKTEPRRHHRFIDNLPARFSDRTHYIYICICGYAEAVPAAGGAPLALDADFKPQPDAGGIVTHLDLVRAHEMN